MSTLPPLAADLLDRIYPSDKWPGWVVGETETHLILVLPMLVNDRIIESAKNDPMTYHRYWCYPQGGAAFIAALAWEPSPKSEPVGWIKSWDQRYSEPGIGQVGADGKKVGWGERDE